jgi:hypothetical protein
MGKYAEFDTLKLNDRFEVLLRNGKMKKAHLAKGAEIHDTTLSRILGGYKEFTQPRAREILLKAIKVLVLKCRATKEDIYGLLEIARNTQPANKDISLEDKIKRLLFLYQSLNRANSDLENEIIDLLENQVISQINNPITLSIWNIPHRRNPFFTGRDDLLIQLHNQLATMNMAVLPRSIAISGLGGIGKTQIAVEYAYRYRDDYQVVLWAKATAREALITDFLAIASLLELPEQSVTDQQVIVTAVQEWLADHVKWLLILDSADDVDLAIDFLPTEGNGHILLTTSAQATGPITNRIEVERMSKKEGSLFLLRRAKVLALDTPIDGASKIARTKAEAIVAAVGGLPLALDQAGAYIEETNCSLATYLDHYQQRQANLLRRRGKSTSDHPESVAATWSLSFERLESNDVISADLFRLFALDAPYAITEEIII